MSSLWPRINQNFYTGLNISTLTISTLNSRWQEWWENNGPGGPIKVSTEDNKKRNQLEQYYLKQKIWRKESNVKRVNHN